MRSALRRRRRACRPVLACPTSSRCGATTMALDTIMGGTTDTTMASGTITTTGGTRGGGSGSGERGPSGRALGLDGVYGYFNCVRPRCSTASRLAAMSSPLARRIHWLAETASIHKPAAVCVSSMRW